MKRLLSALAALLLLAGCANKPDARIEALTDEALRHFVSGDIAALRAISIMPEINGEEGDRAFGQIRAILPSAERESARSVNWSSATTPAGEFRSLRRIYHYQDQTLTVSAQAKVYDDGSARLTGFHVQLLQNSEIPDTSFTFKGKEPPQIALLVAFVLIAALMISTCVLALFRRRWAWAALALVGITTIHLNWLTGQILYSLVTVRLELFGISVVKGTGPLDPWILTSTVPIGAIMFWILGKWRRKEARPAPDERWSLRRKQALPPSEDQSNSTP